MSITKNPNPILRKKSAPLAAQAIKSAEIQKLIAEMKKTVEETADAIGLAAPQIGVSKRIFVVKLPNNEYDGVFINPELVEGSKRTMIDEEGCLSVPKTYGTVVRPRTVTVKAYNAQGKQFKVRAKGLLARVLQHEIDHLDGKLFIDKAQRVFTISN